MVRASGTSVGAEVEEDQADLAPQRKTDPGPRFPWKRLADEGLIPWFDPARVAERLTLARSLAKATVIERFTQILTR